MIHMYHYQKTLDCVICTNLVNCRENIIAEQVVQDSFVHTGSNKGIQLFLSWIIDFNKNAFQ